MNTTKNTGMSGFTLVELSIVLVIIGLIIGGVLVGQDLIKAAEIRATIEQKEKYDTATNTFRGKYDGLPGDLTHAANFFSGVSVTAVGNDANGDGDGLVEGAASTTAACAAGAAVCLGGESAIYWYELNQAKLISDGITTSTTVGSYTLSPTDATLPASKLGKGGRVMIDNRLGQHYLVITNPTGPAVAGVMTSYAAGISPLEAFQLDTKMDDGKPGYGSVLSLVPATPVPGVASATFSNTVCSTAVDTYNTGSTNAVANSPLCSLSLRTSF